MIYLINNLIDHNYILIIITLIMAVFLYIIYRYINLFFCENKKID